MRNKTCSLILFIITICGINNVPIQLSRNIDDSVKRFKFKDVIKKKTRYQELSGPINWLDKCKLISKCQPIDCEPCSPLPARSEIEFLFKTDSGAVIPIEVKVVNEQEQNHLMFMSSATNLKKQLN